MNAPSTNEPLTLGDVATFLEANPRQQISVRHMHGRFSVRVLNIDSGTTTTSKDEDISEAIEKAITEVR